MDQLEDRHAKALVNALYQSLARPVEMSFKDGRVAHGLFSGFNHSTKQILVSNFCFANSETMEPKRKVDTAELMWYVVRESPSFHPHPPAFTKPPKSQAHTPGQASTPIATRAKDAQANGHAGTDKPQRGIKNDEFRTDVEISKRTADAKTTGGDKKPAGSKVFKRFAVDTATPLSGELLEASGKIGTFDQFQANNKAFGIESHYDENDYTTYLDIRSVPKQALLKADRLAQEILESEKDVVAVSRHRQEDRNEIELLDNEDEEALFSAVIREKPAKGEAEGKKAEAPAPKATFSLKTVPAEKAQSFRATIGKAVLAQKPVTKEASALASAKSNLVNQLSEAQPTVTPFFPQQVAQPPMMQQPMYMPMGYPQMQYGQPAYGYYPQGIYFQSFPNASQAYHPSYYQQPK